MGMFDYLKVLVPLPAGDSTTEFQTKDTAEQACAHYELRDDGTLWRTSTGMFDEDPQGGAIEPVQEKHNGQLRFCGWEPAEEYIGWFINGVLLDLRCANRISDNLFKPMQSTT